MKNDALPGSNWREREGFRCPFVQQLAAGVQIDNHTSVPAVHSRLPARLARHLCPRRIYRNTRSFNPAGAWVEHPERRGLGQQPQRGDDPANQAPIKGQRPAGGQVVEQGR